MNEFDENRDGRIEMAEVGDTFKFPLPDDKSIFASNKPTTTHLLLKIKMLPCDTAWVLNPDLIQFVWVCPVIQHTTTYLYGFLKAKELVLLESAEYDYSFISKTAMGKA